MERVIFEVDAWVVDANGTFNRLQNYPKRFDSKSSGDVIDTEHKAKAEYHNTLGTMWANQANRQIQTAIMRDAEGVTILRECIKQHSQEVEPEEQN